MDWTKAKTIVIIALLLTDIFLLAVYGLNRMDNVEDEKTVEQETLQLLEEKGVHIDMDLPEKHPKMAVLSVRYLGIEEALLKQCLEEQTSEGNEPPEEKARLFLEACGIWDENVDWEKTETEGEKTYVTFRAKMEDYYLEDSSMVCILENNCVSGLEQSWIDPVDFGKVKGAVISASEALIRMLSWETEEELLRVREMELVYRVDTESQGIEGAVTDTAFPTWKITYNEGKVAYINAFAE